MVTANDVMELSNWLVFDKTQAFSRFWLNVQFFTDGTVEYFQDEQVNYDNQMVSYILPFHLLNLCWCMSVRLYMILQ